MPRMSKNVTYDRPIDAKLFVRLGNGEEWAAGEEDIKKFGYIDPIKAYARLEEYLLSALDGDRELTETGINCLRYAVECALFYEHMPDSDISNDIKKLEAAADKVLGWA